jgi:magnesium transporter
MKQMTSISIILMIPTLIASLYGMNSNDLENNAMASGCNCRFYYAFVFWSIFVQKRKMVLRNIV